MNMHATVTERDAHRRDPFRSVQYMRALAAIAVAIGHAAEPSWKYLLYSGVDLFFVISGFVMVISSAHRAPLDFLKKRVFRVMPMWWVVLTVAFALGITHNEQFWKSAFLVPTFFMNGHISGVAWLVGWTLVLEAVFYSYFALALAFRRAWLVFAIIPAAVLFNGMAGHSPVLNALTHPMLYEFLYGAAVAYAVKSGRTLPGFLRVAGIALLAIGHNLEGTRSLVIGLPVALFFAGAVQVKLPHWRVPHFLGDASYSIYLFHCVALEIAWWYIPEASWWPLTAIAGIGLGCLAYWLVERRILAITNPKHVTQQRAAPAEIEAAREAATV
ncbi:acyltransferase family protein [Sphingomicrobium nitratireducens]|uniref:acyltransferase family protein n=1 Tax=Sphingomicrobium nitratireducens TaxID=2964666 RepID=UPI00223FC424|nr:acyltransferase [Sphingomicrobium nitratireducens]